MEAAIREVMPLDVVQVEFDSRVYALDVVKKAAYRFLKVFVTEISLQGDFWVCKLTFVEGADSPAVQKTLLNFQSEVLDQDLRASISRETEPLRNAVLALAFSRAGLEGSE
jgi:His-Xaa-Ser system protein HxsD